MTTGTASDADASAMTVLRARATASARVVRKAVGWGITLSGLAILLTQIGATIAGLWHGVADALVRAIV